MSGGFRPLSAFPLAERRDVRCVLCDVDDTLTSDGRLTASAYLAMERLANAGLAVIPVTGRPAGWCDMIARQWPVVGVVGENGALSFRYDRSTRRVIRRYWYNAEQRATDRCRLQALADRIAEIVPAAHPASDQRYRETDLAIDWCEDVTALTESEVERVVACAEASGATVKVSSIHINIWFGEFSKLAMTNRLIDDLFGRTMATMPSRCVFVGDSPNDSSMFAFFRNSIGVANIRRFLDRIEVGPAYVTNACGGEGFAEVGDALLAAR